MDLWCIKGKTYSARSVAEGRCCSLVKFRSMQRPSSMEARCAVATAAELQCQMGERGRICGTGRMKEDLIGSIYKEGPLKSAKNEEAENMSYPTTRTPRFSGWSSRQRYVGIHWIKCTFMTGDVMVGYRKFRR